MNNVLIGIGVLIVACFAALFAVPHFVDWNSYRGVIEEEASRMLARDVRIGGDIKLKLLPVPSFTVDRLRIADSITGSGEPLFRAERVDAKLSIVPLVRGVLEANEIELVKPVLHLVLDDAGAGNWRNLAGGRGTFRFAPSEIALQSVKISNGTFSFLDRSGTRERLTIDAIEGQVSAPALKGPYRFRGRVGSGTELRDVGLATIPPDANGAIQFKATVKDVTTSASATLDGLLHDPTGQLRLTGELSGLLPRPSPAGGSVQGSAKSSAANAKSAPAGPLADLKASISGDGNQLELKNLSIAFDSAGRPEVLAGDAKFTWDKDLTTVASLATPWLDLDNVIGNPEGGNPLLALAAFAQRINGLVPATGTSSTVLQIDQASLGHEAVSGIRLDARSTAGLLAVEQLRATLPGGSKVEVQGRIAGEGSATTFDGDMTLHGSSLARLAGWATAGGVVIAPANDQSFQLRSRVTLEPTRSAMPDIVAAVGGSMLEGSIDYSWQDNRQVRVSVEGARIDARAIAPDKLNLKTLIKRISPDHVSGQSDAANVTFNLKTAELVLPDQILRDVSVQVDKSPRGVNIERMQFTSTHGVAVNVSTVAPATADLRAGAQAAQNPVPASLALRGSIAAGDVDGVQILAQFLDIPAAFIPERLIAGLVPLRLAGSIVPAVGGANAPMTIVADGHLGGADAKIKAEAVSGSWRTAPANVDIVLLAPSDVQLRPFALALLRGEAVDAQRGLRPSQPVAAGQPVALKPSATSVSRLAVRATGIASDGLATVVRFDSPDLTVFVHGTSRVTDTASVLVSGDGVLDARDGRSVIDELAGLRLNLPDPLILRGQARFTAAAGTVDVSDLALTAGEATQVNGQLRVETMSAATTAGTVQRRLTGGLAISALDLVAMLPLSSQARGTTAAVTAASAAAGTGQDGLWPVSNFDFGGNDSVDLALNVKTGRLRLAEGVTLTDASFALLGRPGVVEIKDLAGGGLGGRIAGSARLERARAGAALTATISATQAQLAALSTTGHADVVLALSGSGLNPAGLAAAMTGTGTITLGATTVHEVTPDSLQAAVDGTLKAPAEKLNTTLRAALAAEGARPAVQIGPRTVKIKIEDGMARGEPVVLTTAAGRVVTQAALDLSTSIVRGDWRVETRLLPPPPLPPAAGPIPAEAPPPISTEAVPLPALVQRFSMRLAAPDVVPRVEYPQAETEGLERELAVRKVERDLAELERLRRIDESRIAAERAHDEQIAAEKAKAAEALAELARQAQAVADKAAADQAEWKRQTEIKQPATREPAPEPAQ